LFLPPSCSSADNELRKSCYSQRAPEFIERHAQKKTETAIKELKRDTGKDTVLFLRLDLADLSSVKAAAEEFIGKESALPTSTTMVKLVYVHAADVTYPPIDMVTSQGYDLRFGMIILGTNRGSPSHIGIGIMS
jgi:hypothetical protein